MKKTAVTVLVFFMVLLFSAMPVYAAGTQTKEVNEEPMYDSFTYTVSQGKTYMLNSPAPYRVVGIIDSESLGAAMSSPTDMYTADGGVYIADKKENSIIFTDNDFKVNKVYKSFVNNGKNDTFSEPQGICVVGGKIYIADAGNKRIVILNKNGELVRIIERWDSTLLSDSLEFVPQKIDVDSDGRIYVVVKGVYEGIMEFYDDGTFGGFVGSIPVDPDPLTALWKKLLSKEQASKLESFIPVEYTNLCIDDDGFIYTVSLMADDQKNICRLNAAGEDILIRDSLGNIDVCGVVSCANRAIDISKDKSSSSNLVDILSDADGTYYVLDSKYSRIFTYDSRGNMLFSFAGMNSGQNGTFIQPTALAMIGDKLCVSDSESGKITVFQRTDYAESIFKAKALYANDEYKESIDEWNTVLQYNSEFMLAYDMIGKAEYQMKNYTSAMDYFKTATDKEGYSKAFERWRDNLYSKYFLWIILGIIILIVGIYVICRIHKKRKMKNPSQRKEIVEDMKYPFYVIFHPFDGFWDLKYEKRGKMWVSTVLIFLTIVVMTLERGFTGFAVTSTPNYTIDIIYQLQLVLVPILLFLIGNVSITTLMDGKGTVKQLYTATGYALTPLIITKIPMIVISNLFTQTEAAYVTMVNTIAIIWMIILIFAALLSTHEYTAGKTVATLILTFVAMVIICFICVLFFSLFTELIGFVYSLITEWQYR